MRINGSGLATTREFLLISWNFPPLINGGVYRPTAICQGAARAGWGVTVLGGLMPAQISLAGSVLLSRVPPAVRTMRPPTHDPKAGSAVLPNVDGGMLNALEAFDLAAEEHCKVPPPIVVATGPPFQSFVAGMWIANHFGSRLVLDYRDEWTEGPHDHIERDAANRKWEAKCLRRADRVVFTTHSQLQHQLQAFPELAADKCFVVPNGWDPDDFAPAQQEGEAPTTAVGNLARIMFFGNLGTWWDLPNFLQALGQTFAADAALRDRVEVHFVGHHARAAIEAIAAFPYRSRIVLTEHVPKAKACELMRRADVLLLMNPRALNRYIPGKMFEYVAAGAPILVYGEGGEMPAIVTGLDVGLVVPVNDAAMLGGAIRRLLDKPRLPNAATAAWLARHTREETIAQFVGVLDQVLQSPANQ